MYKDTALNEPVNKEFHSIKYHHKRNDFHPSHVSYQTLLDKQQFWRFNLSMRKKQGRICW
jgi:hypothetical protein